MLVMRISLLKQCSAMALRKITTVFEKPRPLFQSRFVLWSSSFLNEKVGLGKKELPYAMDVLGIDDRADMWPS